MLSTTLDLEANPFLRTMEKVNKAVEGFRGRIVTFAAAFSGLRDVAETVHAAFEKFAGVLELGAHLTDLSASTGEAKSSLLVLEQAFRNAGKGADQVSPFIARLHKALGGVNDEGKNTTAAFNALGTSAADLKNLPILEQVQKLSEGFRGIASNADRGQAAIDLFGRTGEELLALFREDEALTVAREQVGGLGDTMEKIGPLLANLAHALEAISLKFQQLSGGFILGVSGELTDFSTALNKIDLTGIGKSLGEIATVFIKVGKAMKELIPVVLSLGAGWLASMAATQVASVGIVAAVRSVTVATVTGIRAIMASLGPLGLAVAAATYLWMKFHHAAAGHEEPETPESKLVTRSSASANFASNLGVSSLTARGLSAFTGVNGVAIGVDPVAARIDRSNALLAQIAANTAPKKVDAPHTKRPDLAV